MGLTPLNAQTADAFVNQPNCEVLSFSAEYRNLFKTHRIHDANVCFLSDFLFLLSLALTVTKLPEVTHWLLYFKVCWKPSKLATL